MASRFMLVLFCFVLFLFFYYCLFTEWRSTSAAPETIRVYRGARTLWARSGHIAPKPTSKARNTLAGRSLAIMCTTHYSVRRRTPSATVFIPIIGSRYALLLPDDLLEVERYDKLRNTPTGTKSFQGATPSTRRSTILKESCSLFSPAAKDLIQKSCCNCCTN